MISIFLKFFCRHAYFLYLDFLKRLFKCWNNLLMIFFMSNLGNHHEIEKKEILGKLETKIMKGVVNVKPSYQK